MSRPEAKEHNLSYIRSGQSLRASQVRGLREAAKAVHEFHGSQLMLGAPCDTTYDFRWTRPTDFLHQVENDVNSKFTEAGVSRSTVEEMLTPNWNTSFFAHHHDAQGTATAPDPVYLGGALRRREDRNLNESTLTAGWTNLRGNIGSFSATVQNSSLQRAVETIPSSSGLFTTADPVNNVWSKHYGTVICGNYSPVVNWSDIISPILAPNTNDDLYNLRMGAWNFASGDAFRLGTVRLSNMDYGRRAEIDVADNPMDARNIFALFGVYIGSTWRWTPPEVVGTVRFIGAPTITHTRPLLTED